MDRINITPDMLVPSFREKYWSKVDTAGECWPIKGYVPNPHKGYVRVFCQGRGLKAHRVAWVMAFGYIPLEMDIDHCCRNTRCVRVKHLKLVTSEENNRLQGERRTECKRRSGNRHPWYEGSWYVNAQGKRCCKACRDER